MQAPIEVVILNYRRPQNIGLIVESLRTQTVTAYLTLIDQPGQDEFRVPATTRADFDRVIDIFPNQSAFARYGLAPLWGCRYTLFLDDDMLPGARCVEHFLHYAELLSDKFCVLGQVGRILPASLNYQIVDEPRGDSPRPVDFVIRGYCYLTERLSAIDPFRRSLGIAPREDDLVAETALQVATGLPACLTPRDADPATLMNQRELPAPFAHSKKPEHLDNRDATVIAAMRRGYVPLRQRGRTPL